MGLFSKKDRSFVVERHVNYYYRTFNMRHKILLDNMDELYSIVEDLCGVGDTLICRPYALGVEIGKAFDWEKDKIEEAVIEVINKFFERQNTTNIKPETL